MLRAGTAVGLTAALGFLLFAAPAEGTQDTSLAPRVKGVVISRTEQALIVDQVLALDTALARTVRVVMTWRTHVAGRRNAAPAISVRDLVRADGFYLPDGSLEALHVEVILTAEEALVARRPLAGFAGMFWNWILNGSLSIPLP